MKLPIVLNMIRCRECGQVLLSTSRHDFRMCECGTFTDGGTDYIRRGAKNLENIEDFTVVLIDGKLRFVKDVGNE